MREAPKKIRMPKPQRPAHPPVPALEWISDISGRAARATAIGNHRILIENHRGILDFSGESVRLATSGGPLSVIGQDLSLSEVRENALIIHGRIRQVNLPEDGGEE